MVETCLEPHSHPQFLDNTHSPNLSWIFTSTHHLLCAPVCVCLCYLGFFNWVLRVHNSGLLSSDLWIGCCVCTILVCALAGVVCVNGVWAMFASRSDECARQARGRSSDACMRHVGNARNAGWKKPSAILRNSNSTPLRNCVVLDCSARQLCVGPRVVTWFIYPRRSRYGCLRPT